MTPSSLIRLLLTLVCVALFATGCGATEIDSALLLEEIEGSVLAENPGLLENLACPTIEVGAGIEADCTASIDGDPVTVSVAQTNDDGAVSVELQEPLFDVAGAADKLGERFEFELGVATSVDCGEPPLRVLKVGMVIDCLANDGTTNRAVSLTVLDESGAYDLTLG